MLKHALIFLIISILAVIFSSFTQQCIVYIHLLFITIKNWLMPVFHALDLGPTMLRICLLMLIPLTAAGIPALLYRLVKGRQMPYLIESTWVFWLILALSTILIR